MSSYMYKQTWRSASLWSYLLAIYCTCLIISNVLASKVFLLGPVTLPCAVIVFPIVYILNDMMAELFPLHQVRKGIFLAFLLNLLAVVCYEIAILLPGFDNLFEQALGSSWRVLLASFLAYLVGANVNAWLMRKMHFRNGDKKLFLRCIASTVAGETLDAVIFISIAFFGTMETSALAIMIVAQASFKIVYEIIVFPATNAIIGHAKKYLMEA